MIEDVEDLYSFYVFYFGIDSAVAETWDISQLNRLVINKVAIDNYLNS